MDSSLEAEPGVVTLDRPLIEQVREYLAESRGHWSRIIRRNPSLNRTLLWRIASGNTERVSVHAVEALLRDRARRDALRRRLEDIVEHGDGGGW